MDRISNRDIHTNCQGNIYLTYNISTKTQKPYKLIQERMLQAWNGTKLWSLKDKNMKYTVYHQMVQSKASKIVYKCHQEMKSVLVGLRHTL